LETGKRLVYEDRWLEDGSMKRKFSRLFSISFQRKVNLRQVGGWNNNGEWV